MGYGRISPFPIWLRLWGFYIHYIIVSYITLYIILINTHYPFKGLLHPGRVFAGRGNSGDKQKAGIEGDQRAGPAAGCEWRNIWVGGSIFCRFCF